MTSLLDGFSAEQLAAVTVEVPLSEADQALRNEEKRLMADRKRLREILEDWPSYMVSSKARRDYGAQLGEINKLLRDIRKQRLG